MYILCIPCIFPWLDLFMFALSKYSQNILHLSTINLTTSRSKLMNWSYEWVSDCSLTPKDQLFNYIMKRTSYISMRWWWSQFCLDIQDFQNITDLYEFIFLILLENKLKIFRWKLLQFIIPTKITSVQMENINWQFM